MPGYGGLSLSVGSEPVVVDRSNEVLDWLATNMPDVERAELAAILKLASVHQPVLLTELPMLLGMSTADTTKFIEREQCFYGQCGPLIEIIDHNDRSCARPSQFCINILNRAWAESAKN